jgi:hypothetical protein
MKDMQQTLDEYNAERFLLDWVNAHKRLQFVFSLVRKSKCWEMKRLKENRYLGTIELTTGRFSLEIYKRDGEWTTDQKVLMPVAAVVRQSCSFVTANR